MRSYSIPCPKARTGSRGSRARLSWVKVQQISLTATPGTKAERPAATDHRVKTQDEGPPVKVSEQSVPGGPSAAVRGRGEATGPLEAPHSPARELE